MVGPMAEPVKTRAYHSPRRAEQARRTRHAVLEAACRMFTANGYGGTTIAAIAAAAGVAVDTVYASVGAKPVVFRLLLETAISGTDDALPAEQRSYVKQIRAAPTAVEKVRIYAEAVCEINERMAAVHVVLRDAASVVDELAEMREEIAQRRAQNMRRFVQDLADTGQLRPDLDLDEAADAVWATSAPEMYHLLVAERGWSHTQLESWLAATWTRLFVGDPSQPSA